MTGESIATAIAQALESLNKPLSIILAGHNGAGKSTLWYEHVADSLQLPLINADRMMLSTLPEPDPGRGLRQWARDLRDTNASWMMVAQKAGEAFVGHAMGRRVPFALETVFSHWAPLPNGTVHSRIDLIHELQRSGYFVLLIFVGLANQWLSVGRVGMRVAKGGHAVPPDKLLQRFRRTQLAVRAALDVADAAVLFDNSATGLRPFMPVHVRTKTAVRFDVRQAMKRVPKTITAWLDIVVPRS